MKHIWRILQLIALAGIIFIIYKMSNFELLPVEETILAEVVDDHKTIYKITKVAGNATTNDVLHLTKHYKNKRYIIYVVEGYDTLESARFLNDSLIELIVKKEGYQHVSIDTLVINILTKKAL